MSRLSEFGGQFVLKIDGKDFPVKVKKAQKWEILEIQTKAMKESLKKEDYEKLDVVLSEILAQSIPESTEDERLEFMLRFSDEFLMELYIAFRWIQKEALEKIKNKEEDVAKNLLNRSQEVKKS